MKLFSNNIINTTLIAWFIAQFLKVVTGYVTDKKFNLRHFVSAGGMPSSHSATVVCLTVCIGRKLGFETPEFAISFIFSVIVMYDATGVRRAAGQQAKILNKLVDDLGKRNTDTVFIRLKELLGHTPKQVFFGAILGLLIGLVGKI